MSPAIGVYFDAFAPSIAAMPGDFDHSDFVDPDFEANRQLVRFDPDAAGRMAADAAWQGWRRAVRAALGWARDRDGDAGIA